MYIGKLRVETQETTEKNPFYGTYVRKNVVEQELLFEKHKNVPTPPCGICGEIQIGSTTMKIEINKYVFENYEDGHAETNFQVEGKVYSLFVQFKNNSIESLKLDVWESLSDYYDDEDPSESYTDKDFTKIDKYVS